MDGAGWHSDDIALPFSNLTILMLPAYSPELNSIEQVWQWLRQKRLENRCFQSYEDILNACTEAWQQFITDNERVKSLCWREWIKLT
tara:strand:- start:703 stop:963 length:261 start_codon:yes stop_codon:yes gene_type:complete